VPQDGAWAARVLPVSQHQSCVACGSREWAWLFPLEPQTGRAFAFGYFVCTCDDDREALASDSLGRVAAALAHAADGDATAAREYATALMSDRLGPPLSRRSATGG
jgi:hypothetical protein